MGKIIKILDSEKIKPLGITKDGKFITLREILSMEKEGRKEFNILDLNDLNEQDMKKLVLKRYKLKPKDDKLVEYVIEEGSDSFTNEQNIKEIKNDTEIGQELIKIELQLISRILDRLKKGEIE